MSDSDHDQYEGKEEEVPNKYSHSNKPFLHFSPQKNQSNQQATTCNENKTKK